MKANVQACKHLAGGKPWHKSGVFSAGCGAAVRMPPIGLFLFASPEALIRAALDDCAITHTEPHARGASVAVAYLVSRLIQTTPDSVLGDHGPRVEQSHATTPAMLNRETVYHGRASAAFDVDHDVRSRPV